MIVDLHIDTAAGGLKALGDLEIVLARRRIPGWVVVHKDGGSGIQREDQFDYFPAVHCAGGKGPFKKDPQVNDLVTAVQQDDEELLHVAVLEVMDQVLLNLAGPGEVVGPYQVLFQIAPGHRLHQLQTEEIFLTDSLDVQKLVPGGFENAAQATEAFEEPFGRWLVVRPGVGQLQ